MRKLLITIAAVVLVGCGESQQSASAPEAKPAEPSEPVAVAAKPEPPPVKAPDISIHDAALDGNIEAVKQHLAAGTDVNARYMGGETPLHFTALDSQKEIVELLISKGADVNAKNDYGETPLDKANYLPETSTADLLRKHGGKTAEELKTEGNPAEPDAEAKKTEPPTAKAPDISIHSAASGGDIEAVKQHLAAGTDVNARYFGATPLHASAGLGRKEIVELLIAEGADVNAGLNSDNEHKGKTPLNAAIEAGKDEIAHLLRKHGGKTGQELKAEGK